MNWLLISVGVVLLVGMLNGYIKGAVRILVSLVTTVATIVIVFFATPYVSQAVYALTPFDEMLESTCYKSMVKVAESSSKILEEYKIDSENLGNIEEIELPRALQISLIENADLPSVFKELLISNNNNEVYELVGAENFTEYVSKYMTKLFIDIMSFLLTFLIVTIVIRAIVFALDFVANLPVLGILNRLSGAVVGGSISLIIVWVFFIVVTLMYTLEVGQMLMGMIGESEILLILYQINPILKLVTMLR